LGCERFLGNGVSKELAGRKGKWVVLRSNRDRQVRRVRMERS